MNTFSVVSTLSIKNWNEYGEKMISSFEKYWPADIQMYCYFEGKIPELKTNRVNFIDYHKAIPEHKIFKKRNLHRHKDINNFKAEKVDFQAIKFSYKVYAQLKELENPKTKYIIYLDGDNLTKKKISHDLLQNLVEDDIYLSFLNRMPYKYTESGFIIWNTQNIHHKLWCQNYRNMYDKDMIFNYEAWHDCIAFDEVTFPMIRNKLIKCIDLSYGQLNDHPLSSGPLRNYFDHLKGIRRKKIGYSNKRSFNLTKKFIKKYFHKKNTIKEIIILNFFLIFLISTDVSFIFLSLFVAVFLLISLLVFNKNHFKKNQLKEKVFIS